MDLIVDGMGVSANHTFVISKVCVLGEGGTQNDIMTYIYGLWVGFPHKIWCAYYTF